MTSPKHFLDIDRFDQATLRQIVARGRELKALRRDSDAPKPLAGRTLVMIFEKPSTRTRVSFQVGMQELGGNVVLLTDNESQLGRGETVADTARVLSRYADAIMIRTDDHAKIEEMAHFATVPVINGLTDLSHPCQIVADLLTIIEHRKALPGLVVAWLGDGNNVLNSIVEAAGLMKFTVRIGCPDGYDPDPDICSTVCDYPVSSKYP